MGETNEQAEPVVTSADLTKFFLELAKLCGQRDWTFDQAMLHLCHQHLESALATIEELEETTFLNDGARTQLKNSISELERDLAALRAENQRFREAIQGIFDAKEYNGDRWVGALYHAQQKALAALAQNPIAHEHGEK